MLKLSVWFSYIVHLALNNHTNAIWSSQKCAMLLLTAKTLSALWSPPLIIHYLHHTAFPNLVLTVLVLINTWSVWSYQQTSSSCHGSVLDWRFVTPHHTTNAHHSIVVKKYGSLKVCLVIQYYIQQTINLIPASKWELEIRTLMWWCTYVYLGQYRYWASKRYRVCRDCFYLYTHFNHRRFAWPLPMY